MAVVTVELARLDPYLTCKLCGDYFVDAVTVNACLHTFCRDCLARCVRRRNECPECRTDLGLNAFASKVIFDRNIQALVDKILPEHAADSARKVALRKDARVDLAVLFPHAHEGGAGDPKDDEDEPFEVVVRALPDLSAREGCVLPALSKSLLQMSSAVMLYKLAQFVHRRLADQQGQGEPCAVRPEQVELLVNGRVVARSKTFGSLVPAKASNSVSAPLVVHYRRK